MFDFWGLEMKRFYQMDTLCHAVEWMLHTKRDRFLMRSVRDALGPAPVNSLVFELFQEGKFQLIFRLRAGNVKRRHHQFAFVVAKRGGDFSTVAQGEHAILTQLHARAPEYVVQPFGGGNIFLPDRHNRPEHGRDIYAYLTQWLSEYHELGVDKDLQLIVNIVPRHKCTVDQTERIKGQIVEVVLRTYDAKKGECMEMPQVASGDFVVTHPTRGEPRVKLIACRRMLRHVTPVKLVDKILGASWDWGGREFHLPPADPGVLFSAFERALGAETARDWFRQYVVAVKARRVPAQAAYPVELLEPFAQ